MDDNSDNADDNEVYMGLISSKVKTLIFIYNDDNDDGNLADDD